MLFESTLKGCHQSVTLLPLTSVHVQLKNVYGGAKYVVRLKILQQYIYGASEQGIFRYEKLVIIQNMTMMIIFQIVFCHP